jgi:hypothetical protein
MAQLEREPQGLSMGELSRSKTIRITPTKPPASAR